MSDREKAEQYVFEDYGDLFSNNNDEAANAVQAYLAGAEAKDLEWQAKVRGLVDALEFYANRNTWKMSCGDEVSQHYDVIPGKDTCSGNGNRYYGGLKAREALTKFTSGQPAQGVMVPNTVVTAMNDFAEVWEKGSRDLDGDNMTMFILKEFGDRLVKAIKVIKKDGG